MKIVIDTEKLQTTPYYAKNCVVTMEDIIKCGTPLPKGEWLRLSDLSENEDDRYKCSHCGNIVHHSSKMNLYTFNSFCGRCGSNNER